MNLAHPASPPPDEPAELYLSILRDFPALIWRANITAECDWFNSAWLEFRGRSVDQERGYGWAEGVHSDDFARCCQIYRDNFEARTPFEMEYRLLRHDGVYRWIRDYGRPFHGPSGGFLGYIGACYDISDLKEMTERLEVLASHDPLTGAPNRRAFIAELNRAISFANRGKPSVVLFTDVDGFKAVNDRYGHERGDQVLAQIVRAMQGAVRDVDMVARIGGDEFGCVLWEQSDECPDAVMHRLQEAVEAVGRAHGVPLGLSIGCAPVEPKAEASKVMALADERMYEAKGQGLASR